MEELQGQEHLNRTEYRMIDEVQNKNDTFYYTNAWLVENYHFKI